MTTLRKVNTSLNRQQLVAYLLSNDILRVKRANKQLKTENVLNNVSVRREDMRKPSSLMPFMTCILISLNSSIMKSVSEDSKYNYIRRFCREALPNQKSILLVLM